MAGEVCFQEPSAWRLDYARRQIPLKVRWSVHKVIAGIQKTEASNDKTNLGSLDTKVDAKYSVVEFATDAEVTTVLTDATTATQKVFEIVYSVAKPKLRPSVCRHTSKFKDTLRWRQKNDSNSEYILVVHRDQILESSGPGTYSRASRKAPPVTFADESYEFPKYTSD